MSMQTLVTLERTLTELDHTRLTHLLRGNGASPQEAGIAALSAALDAADIVPSRAVAPDVVTMYSRAELEDPGTGRRQVLTVCYPEDAEPAAGFVSVLSPVGAGLLGLRVGMQAQWHTPGGRAAQAQVRALLFQPEASGDFTL